MSQFWKGYWVGIFVAVVVSIALDAAGLTTVAHRQGHAIADWMGMPKR